MGTSGPSSVSGRLGRGRVSDRALGHCQQLITCYLRTSSGHSPATSRPGPYFEEGAPRWQIGSSRTTRGPVETRYSGATSVNPSVTPGTLPSGFVSFATEGPRDFLSEWKGFPEVRDCRFFYKK